MGASQAASGESPAEIKSTNTKDARLRDQPGLAFFAEAFAAGQDETHLQRGCEPGVTMIELAPTSGLEEDKGEAEWPLWNDAWNEDTARGGAVAFVPADAGVGSACIYFVHGGGFEYGGPVEDGYDSLCSRLAKGSGHIVVCPDHPLSGENRPFKAPDILQALVRGLRWLVRFDPVSKERRTSSPPQIVLAGDSAGATQAFSLLLLALSEESEELKKCLAGLALVSPWLDLTCGSHTYVSNAFAAEANTGDLAFRAHADENRAGFKGMGLTYTGSADLLKDCLFSPYWLSRAESNLLMGLQAWQIPTWICTGASETLAGEVLDFVQQLQNQIPLELWLHEGMFHDWVMYSTDHPFPSKDAAMQQLFDFLRNIRAGTWKPKGIQYYIDPWK